MYNAMLHCVLIGQHVNVYKLAEKRSKNLEETKNISNFRAIIDE